MKRLYFILIALFLLMGEAVYARENGMHKHLYASWYASTYAAASRDDINGADWKRNLLNVSVGYRFNDSWSLYIPYNVELVQHNMTTTKNYFDQGSIGMGASYTFNICDSKRMFEVCASVASTLMKSTPRYLSSDLMIKYGFDLVCSPTIGVGVMYLHSYDKSLADSFAFGITIGCLMF